MRGCDGAGVGVVATSDASDTLAAVAAAVRAGLLSARKTLPPWLLYDETGSALFEEITRLPEYYLTRTERAILASSSDEMISGCGTCPSRSSSWAPVRRPRRTLLLEALLARQPTALYTPVDVSPTALRLAVAELRRFRRLRVRPIQARYPEDLGCSPSGRPSAGWWFFWARTSVTTTRPRRARSWPACVPGWSLGTPSCSAPTWRSRRGCCAPRTTTRPV